MLDRYPRFPIPKHCVNPSEMNYESDMSDTLQMLLSDAKTMAPQGERIYAMLRVTSSVIAMVNRNANDPLFWTHDAALAEKLGSASHFILSVPKSPEDDPHTDYPVFVVQRMVQLACLMVMSKLKQLASFHWADIDPIGDRLAKLLQVPCYEVSVQLQQLRLWAIVTACSLLDPEAQVPFLIEMRHTIRALGYRTAEEAVEYVKSLLWLENIDIIAAESLHGCCNL